MQKRTYTDPNRMSGWNSFLLNKILEKISKLPDDAEDVEFHGFMYRIQDILEFVHKRQQ